MKPLKITLTILLFASPFVSNAQLNFGVAGGVNIAQFSSAKVASIENTSSIENMIGFNAGIMFEVKLPIKVGIELDALYSIKGSSLVIEDAGISSNSDYSLEYIDFPLVAKWYVLKVTSLQIGAQYSYLVGANLNSQDVIDQFNSEDLSAVMGFGVDVNRIHFSARYNFGLVGITKGDSETKSNMFTFSVGLWLNK